MAVPIVFIGAMMFAVAMLFVLTRTGGDATGERVLIEFDSACADAAQPLIAARAEQIGLGDPGWPSSAVLTASLPELTDARSTIPALLARQGLFSLTNEEGTEVLDNTAIEEIAIDLDNAGMPNTLIKLRPHALASIGDSTAEYLTPSIDGEARAANRRTAIQNEGFVTLDSGTGRTADRMRKAADWAIILEHGPLPCPVLAVARPVQIHP